MKRHICKFTVNPTLCSVPCYLLKPLQWNIIFVCIFIINTTNPRSETLILSGTYDITFFKFKNGEIRSNQSSEYNIILYEDSTWEMNVSALDHNLIKYSFDGTNSVGVYKTPNDELLLAVVRDSYYPTDSYLIQLPWFALLSGKYLSADTPAPWVDSKVFVSSVMFSLDFELFEQFPFAPKKAEWLYSEEKAVKSFDSKYLNIEAMPSDVIELNKNKSKRFKNIITENQIVANYEVQDYYSKSNIIIPTKWQLKRYYFEHGYNTNIAMLINGSVEKIDYSDQTHIPSKFTNVFVQDFRFENSNRRIDYVSYNITNSFLPSKNDPRLNDLLKIKVKNAPSFFFDNNKRFFIKFAFYASITALVLSVIYRLYKQKQTKTHTI